MTTKLNLNKRERQAFERMRGLCDAALSGKGFSLSCGDVNAIRDCLGVDLRSICKSKKQMKEQKLDTVRGKDWFFKVDNGQSPSMNIPFHYRFSFQLRKKDNL